MRRAGASLLLCVVTALASRATPPTTTTAPALLEFVSAEYRFRLNHPAEWLVPEHPVSGEVFSLRTPAISPSDARFGVVGLRIDNGPDGQSDVATLIDLGGTIAGYVFKNGGQKVIVKPDQLGAAALAARRIRFVTDQPSGKIATMYVVAVRKRIEYVFTVAAPVELFDQLLPRVDALLKSFELIE